jgi:3-oxoacyl-[acyl-carrier-protein] synthase-3
VYSELKNVKIIGMAAAVSNTWDSVRELSDESEQIINKFIKTTGVEGRYSASPYQCTSDFCFAAAEKVLLEKKIDRDEIGVLVFVTQTADYDLPATACVLQDRLKLSKDCLAFDVNLGCSGFTYGMTILSSLLMCTNTKYGLLLAGDTSAREKSLKERKKFGHSAELLFGDSGTATLVEKTAAAPILVSSNTDGTGFKAIISPFGKYRNPDREEGVQPGTRMDEIMVFNFATSEATDQINDYMRHLGETPDNYDCLVLHQANLMIMKRIGKKTGFPPEKVLVSLNRFGNTSSSSVPITLVDKYGDLQDDKTINALCCGFGVGLSWSTLALPIKITDILPLVHTDEFFTDGYNLENQV